MLSNGQMMKGRISSPGENLRAGVLLIHGLGEHIGRFDELAGVLLDSGIAFIAADLPGHGKSDGKRGCIKNYRLMHEMIDTLSGEFWKTFPGKPLFLYGHSLGGGIAMEYLTSCDSKFKGAVITSPWLKLSFEPEKSKILLAGIMKNIMPSLVQPSGLVAGNISHDSEVVEKYVNDPLVHDRISVGLFHNAVTAGKYSLEHASSLKIPVLLMHGSDDRITSPDGSREAASKSPMIQLKIWDGGYHELHNEPFRREVFGYITDWINLQLS